MMSFCVDTVAVPAALRGRHGVLRAPSLQITSDAAAAARGVVEQAHAQAREILAQAHRESEAAVEAAERQALERAHRLLQALESEREAFLERGKSLVVDLAQAVFERLVAGVTPRERIESALKCVTAEAPRRLINPVLHVHPDDVPFLPALEWDVKEDAGIRPGCCRLEAGNGEWCVDFDAAVSSLQEALASFAAFHHDPADPGTPDSPPQEH